MKERQILFKGSMVRAILDGQKTVTRRIVSERVLKLISLGAQAGECPELPQAGPVHPWIASYYTSFCPKGHPGDRLWVREAFGEVYDYCDHPEMPGCQTEYWHIDWKYRADGETPEIEDGVFTGWKPSIHMPRTACRLLLEITDVRIERLQDITEEQARAEGCTADEDPYWSPSYNDPDSGGQPSCCNSFEYLWGEINGADAWALNPWVWVVEFKQVTP